MTKMRWLPLFMLMIILIPCLAHAATIKKSDGRTLEGVILDEDAGYIYLETDAGITNIPKARILEIDGKVLNAPESKSLQRYATGNTTKVSAGSLGLEKNLVAQVGEGGIGETEFKWYLARAGLRGIKNYREAPITKQQEVLEKAISDEVLFQEALRLGFHQKDITKKNIAEDYKNESRVQGISPSNMQTDEIKMFYEAHPELFHKADRYKIKFFQSGSGDEEFEKHKNNPTSGKSWKTLSDVKKDDRLHLPLSDEDVKKIYGARRNQVVEIKSAFNVRYLFWIIEIEKGKLIPFAQAREKVKHEMIQQQMGKNTKAFDKNFKTRNEKIPTIDALFIEALKAGKHRERMTREGIINAYVISTGKNRNTLASSLRSKTPVEILIKT